MTSPQQQPIATSFVVTLAFIGPLALLYGVSQFLRNALGVIGPDIAQELSLSATALGLLSSLFFLAFVVTQIPLGIAIDRFGPKKVMLGGVTLAAAGIFVFALAPGREVLIAGRIMTGLGCSSFFMGALAIVARERPPHRFAHYAGLLLGFGSIGTLVATAPLAEVTAWIGWRGAFLIVAAITVLIGLLVAWGVPADRPSAGHGESWAQAIAGVREALRQPGFWPLFLMHAAGYSAFATVVGLWAGPWLRDLYGHDLQARGWILLAASLAQVVALMAWGRLQVALGGYVRSIRIGAAMTIASLLVAAFVPLGPVAAIGLLIVFSVSVAYTPITTAHGRALFPDRLTGRGITLMNLGTMGGVFVSQSITGALMDWIGRLPGGAYPPAAYQAVFLYLAAFLGLCLAIYAGVREPKGPHAR
jgi:predicted MFS family arabinose efflux permease